MVAVALYRRAIARSRNRPAAGRGSAPRRHALPRRRPGQAPALFGRRPGPSRLGGRPRWSNAARGVGCIHRCPPHTRAAPEPPDLPENAVPAVRLNGNRILTAGPGRAGIVWDADTRKELARLGGHVGAVEAVAASPDGKRLATGSSDGLVRIWDAETYVPFPGPRGHTGPVLGVQFSADGRRALTIGEDRTARVWDLTTGRELRAFAADSEIDLNAAGTGIIAHAGGSTVIRDVLTGLEVIPPEDASRSATILPARHEEARLAPGESPTGRFSAKMRSRMGRTELHESATKELRRVLTARSGAVRILGFTPDGTRLLTAGPITPSSSGMSGFNRCRFPTRSNARPRQRSCGT